MTKKLRRPRRGSRRYFLEMQPFLWSELQDWPKHCQSIHWYELRPSAMRKKRSGHCIPRPFVMTVVAVNDEGRAVGEDHINAKYLDEDVEHARELRANGYTYRQIANMLDMPIRTVRDYVSGRRRSQSVAGWKKIKRFKKE